MGIGTDEQETVVQFNRNGKTATIYTSDSTVMTKLDKLVGNGYYQDERKNPSFSYGDISNKSQ